MNDPLDLPAVAREDMREHMDLTDGILDARGVPNGVCDLDQNILVPLSRIPVVGVTRGGTGATNESGARAALGLGTAATRNVNTANGVADLNADKEVKQLYKGAAAANNKHVLYANGKWDAPYPSSAGWITQAMLKTGSGSVEGGSVSGLSNVTLPGGRYGFYPQTRADDGSVERITLCGPTSSGSWVSRVSIQVETSGDRGGARQRWVQSSPPYDFGDGEVPLFIFVAFEDGKINGVWEAPDPPWALNGPTDIHTGIQLLSMEELQDASIREPYIDGLINGTLEPVAEGMALKNYDMPIIPHPFEDHLDVVLIDPVGDECLRVSELQRHGHSIADMIYSGALRIDNTALKRAGPPGVPVVRAMWK